MADTDTSKYDEYIELKLGKTGFPEDYLEINILDVFTTVKYATGFFIHFK